MRVAGLAKRKGVCESCWPDLSEENGVDVLQGLEAGREQIGGVLLQVILVSKSNSVAFFHFDGRKTLGKGTLGARNPGARR
jgi:hypothetical protein